MTKPDYKKLDAAIVARLRAGPKFLIALQGGDVRKEAHTLECADNPIVGFKKPAYRFIDGRLQALKKKGVIAYNSKTGWALK